MLRVENHWVTGRFEAFDTVNEITVPDSARDVLPKCRLLCQRLHRLFSPTHPESDISRLNRADGTVAVAPETAELLRSALYFGAATNGLFDVTVAPSVRVWDWKNRTDALPDRKALEQAAQCRGMERVTVSGNAVSLPKEVSVDVGGIAKGYIADQVVHYLESCGVTGALVNLGGNIALLHGKTEQTDWRIGIRQPDGPRGEYFAVFHGRDQSVVTSAASERYCEIGGVRYHHLLDPRSGWPSTSDLASVTIISPSSTCADALSTACFVGGSACAKALLEQFAPKKVEGILMNQKGEVFLSKGLHKSASVTLRYPEMLVM